LTNDVGEEFAVVTFVGAVQEDGVAILPDVLQIGGFVGVEVAASGHVNLLDSCVTWIPWDSWRWWLMRPLQMWDATGPIRRTFAFGSFIAALLLEWNSRRPTQAVRANLYPSAFPSRWP
jgi:hypothetical protein